MNVCGIDLTQHKAAVVVASTHDNEVEPKSMGADDRLPAVSLPLYQGESPLFGDEAVTHRRGAGLTWPYEAMVPVHGEPENGCGRIPLVLAWASLLPKQIDSQLGDDIDTGGSITNFGWAPPGGARQELSAADTIAGSMAHWAKGARERAVLVVPDDLVEAGQQAILNALGGVHVAASEVFLLPRPVSLALVWCRENAERYQDVPADTKCDEGCRIGYLWVACMGLDVWELDLIEIRARRVGNRTWLIPVRKRQSSCALPFWGIDVLANSIEQSGVLPAEYWNRLFATTSPADLLSSDHSEENITEVIRDFADGMTAERFWEEFKDLDAVKSSLARHRYRKRTNLDAAVREIAEDRRQKLPECAKILGAIAGGSLAPSVCKNTRFKTHILPDDGKHDSTFTVKNHEAGALGAAYAAYDMDPTNDNPCYRDTLWPIEIYARDKNNEETWTTLIPPETTIEAGKSYRSPEPIAGLHIRKATDRLKITLRRPLQRPNEHIYRKVPIELLEKTQEKKPILINVSAAPGQGYAKVRAVGEQDGAFVAALNWDKMEKTEKPEPPLPRTLSFIPCVSRIEPDEMLWRSTADLIRRFVRRVDEQQRVDSPLIWDLIGKQRPGQYNFNAWEFAHKVEATRGNTIEKDWFRHYAVFGTEGEINDMSDPDLARKFKRAVVKEYRRHSSQPLLRLGGWMYDLIPDPLRAAMSNTFITFNSHAGAPPSGIIKIVHIHVAGLCSNTEKEYRQFFKAYRTAIDTGRIHDTNEAGDNPPNAEHENEWLRALRNILRFRDDALSPEAVDCETYDVISTYVFNIFSVLVDQRYIHHAGNLDITRKMNNCLRAAPFMLKRRRDEGDYLRPGTHLYEELKGSLSAVAKHGHGWQIPYAATTLKFLDEEAEQDDVGEILGS